MHRGYTTPLVIAIMAFAIVAFLFLIDTAIMPANSNQVTNRTVNKNADDVACTMEAKLCPDGSTVGRSGPKCEFAECPSTTNTNTVTSIEKESIDIIDSTNKNLHIYTSYKLGIRFKYLSTPDEKNGVLEKGNKIYLYYYNGNKPSDPEKGQWVEMFEKNPNTSLADAITTTFLSDRSSNDCFVKNITNTKLEDWEYAGIAYPVVENDTDLWWVNAKKCPSKYTATNWIGYFAMNKNAPDKFYFFSIGQYAISGIDQQTPWQNTIEIATDPTAGWKTYSNDAEKYSLKYPAVWTYEEVTDLNEVQFTKTGDSNIIQPSVRVRTGVTLEDIKQDLVNNLATIREPLSRSIGGYKATGFSYMGAIGADYDLYLLSKESKSFVFFSSKDEVEWEQALDTFTFTN